MNYRIPLSIVLTAVTVASPLEAAPRPVNCDLVNTSSTHVATLIRHRGPSAIRALPRIVRRQIASSFQRAGLKLKGAAATRNSGPTDTELNLACGDDWFVSYEVKDGHPVLGFFELYCSGQTIPIG
jgi:hypothetical protein